ncbi:hypothetical protein NJB1808e29_48860 [Mycobacterium marinum]|nr:hypothetical protein NJB1808e29_48860 [Mycobacterium marinum]
MTSQSTAHPTGPASTTGTTIPTDSAVAANHRHPVVAAVTITTSTTNTTVAVPATITTNPTSTCCGSWVDRVRAATTISAVTTAGRALIGDAVGTQDRATTAGSASTTQTGITALPAGTTDASSGQE